MKQLTTVDHRVEKALEMRAQGKSWRACASALGTDHRNLMRAVEFRCPEAVKPHVTPKERREHFTAMNTHLLEEAGRQLDEALARGEIEAKDLPKTYGILTDKQVRLEGWEHKNQGGGGFGEALARSLSKGGKFTIELEPVEIVDVMPEES